MLRFVLFCLSAAVSLFAGYGQAPPPNHDVILLWANGAPAAQGNTAADKPTLTVFPATGPNKTRTAVIICPGGAYMHLAITHEGYKPAEWLNNLGITAFVLKYRLGPRYHYPAQLWDGERAIRYVRAHAAEYGVDPDRIGIWGFSAGGHLAATVGTHYDSGDPSAQDPDNRPSSRPDFMILAYAVITLEGPHVHLGSRDNLLGEDPDPELVRLLSNQLHVTNETPPTFLFATTEDPIVSVQNSINFYTALHKAGVPVEMHIYQKGHHGVGLADRDPVLHSWTNRLADWLKIQGLCE
jgi:acetyl esterase/lipase